MARIKCHYVDCVFLDDGYCSAALVEIDPDTGCATFSPSDATEGSWDNEESDEWEEDELDDEGEEWLDEDEDEI
jgi:hypothetical protein